jgi:hypothetical protein
VKQPSNIPFKRVTSGEVLPGNPLSEVVLSSAQSNWPNLVIEEHHHGGRELADLMYFQHVVIVNVGRSFNCEFKKDGRLQHFFFAKDAISLSPSHQPFFRRSLLDKNGLADVSRARYCFCKPNCRSAWSLP